MNNFNDDNQSNVNESPFTHFLVTFLIIGLLLFVFSTKLMAREYGNQDYSKEEIQSMIVQEATNNGTVPPALALGVAKVESDFNPSAVSSAGAKGVMQIMPATAKGEFGVDSTVLLDPLTNIRIGILYLERLYIQYNRNWEHALSHYNGGTLNRRNGYYQAHGYTRKYVQDVMNNARMFARNQTEANIRFASNKSSNQNNFVIRSQRDIEHQQALATAALLSGDESNYRLYLAAANQFLDPQNAEDMPEDFANNDNDEMEQGWDVPINDSNNYSVSNSWNQSPLSPSAIMQKEQAQFRKNLLRRING